MRVEHAIVLMGPCCLFVCAVKIEVKSRHVTVTGPRGTLAKDFTHSRIEMKLVKNNTLLTIDMWFGNRKERARTRTIASHITNMIKGVTKGYEYKMRLVYAHFPININIEDGNRTVAIRNFLGEKEVMKVPLLKGTHWPACLSSGVVRGDDPVVAHAQGLTLTLHFCFAVLVCVSQALIASRVGTSRTKLS